jgi:agmatine deiminase
VTEAATPRERGFRWPAEWEEHAGTWLTWPHNPDTWPGRLAEAEDAFIAMALALQGVETLNFLVTDDRGEEHAHRRLQAGGVEVDRVRFHPIETDDGWMRDCGPIFLVHASGARLAVDFGFDAWGGKYPPWDRDAAAGAVVARAAGVERVACPSVVEGGALDTDGRGCILTTGRCLLDPNRGAGRTREAMEALLSDHLAADRVVWLEGEVPGDDTDGHVDQLARFVAPGRVVALPLPETVDPLRAAGLDVVELPLAPEVCVDGERIPASYANFYLANGVALVPVFGVPEDERALAVLADVLPDRQVVGIPCRFLAVGLGAIHCVTQQEPSGTPV